MNILFMCVANSARSQLAEGIAKQIFSSKILIESAGSHPGKLNPLAIEVMNEIGVDISHHWSKSVDNLSEKFIADLNYVITLCAEEVCPTLVSQAKRLHWPLPDPAGRTGTEEEQLRRFRETRDIITLRLKAFAKEIGMEIKDPGADSLCKK